MVNYRRCTKWCRLPASLACSDLRDGVGEGVIWLLGHWTERLELGRRPGQAPNHPHPPPPTFFPRALPNAQQGTTARRAPCMIYIYIYNCSLFIVLYPLFTVDLTQALNNCRERPGGRGQCRRTWGPKGKRLGSREREEGKGPSEGGVWRPQCQRRDGQLERAGMKGTVGQERQRPLKEHTMGSFKNATGSEEDGAETFRA